MYNPETDCVEVSLDKLIRVSFDCQKCNSTVYLNEPSNIAYPTKLAREETGYMPSFPLETVGCREYIEAIGEFN